MIKTDGDLSKFKNFILADLEKSVKKFYKCFLDNNGSLNEVGSSVIYSGITYNEFIRQPCWGVTGEHMCQYRTKDSDMSILLTFYTRNNEVQATKYLDYLLGKDSLWADAVSQMNPVRIYVDKRDAPFAVLFNIPKGEFSNAYLMNFFIALRLPYEFNYRLNFWSSLVDKGLDPSVALAVCCSLETHYDGSIDISNYNHEHAPFNRDVDWSSLFYNNKAFVKGRNYKPCNSGWNGGYIRSTNQLFNDVKQLAKSGKPKQIRSRFVKSDQGQRVCFQDYANTNKVIMNDSTIQFFVDSINKSLGNRKAA
jgi:hypothetical protein